jgi:hypothetical protein
MFTPRHVLLLPFAHLPLIIFTPYGVWIEGVNVDVDGIEGAGFTTILLNLLLFRSKWN